MHNIPERIIPGSQDWERYYWEHIQRYEFAMPFCADKDILDIACGVGYGSYFLAQHGAKSVTGVDISPEAVSCANSEFRTDTTNYLIGDAENLFFRDGSFDIVVSFETIEHIQDPDAFVQEVYRVLKPGGKFICSTPNKDFLPISGQKRKNPYHPSELSLHEYEALMQKYFVVDEKYHQSHSASFLRHHLLLAEIEKINKMARFSLIIRLENAWRKFVKKDHWDISLLSPQLSNFISGDLVIEKINVLSTKLLTFLFVMTKK